MDKPYHDTAELEAGLRHSICVALLKYRQEQDITLQELSRRLSISTAQLRRYLNKNANMSASSLVRICTLLGLSIPPSDLQSATRPCQRGPQ